VFDSPLAVPARLARPPARVSRLDLEPLVLWAGLHGRAPGGTASFVDFWRNQLRRDTLRVPMPRLPEAPDPPVEIWGPARRSEQPTLHQEVKTMLFADIVGYSKLTEQVIPEFVSTFMTRVSQLAASSKHAPRSLNTWGDAVYAVFDYAKDAGRFALELTQMIQEGRDEWIAKGLYADHPTPDGGVERVPVNIRVGLHTGPVFMHYDPVVRRLSFTGAHVNRAARIEPVAKPGEVFASEEFAALAELGAEIHRRATASDGDDPAAAGVATSVADDDDGTGGNAGPGFVCEYAGTKQLAKGYPGRFRIYRVLPKRAFALEELAKAAHEEYRAKAAARGETPATNAALRPWDDLPDDLKEANRAQVADIPMKLRRLGYELAPSYGLKPSEIPITLAQLEELSIREHDRWMDDRIRNGWTYGPARDNHRKHHPSLIPWEQLSEPEKDKDRETVRNLPMLIERAGFRVRKLGGA
jgi:class 3 adenylate cyclase